MGVGMQVMMLNPRILTSLSHPISWIYVFLIKYIEWIKDSISENYD